MAEDTLDKQSYALGKQGDELKEERKMLGGGELALSKIFAFVPGSYLADKTVDTALSLARAFNCELYLSYEGEPSKEITDKVAKSGLAVKKIDLRKSNLENEMVLLSDRHKFDIMIVPSSFGKKSVKQLSITAENLVARVKHSILVIR